MSFLFSSLLYRCEKLQVKVKVKLCKQPKKVLFKAYGMVGIATKMVYVLWVGVRDPFPHLGWGPYHIWRKYIFSETHMGGGVTFICMELYSWVSKVPLPLI